MANSTFPFQGIFSSLAEENVSANITRDEGQDDPFSDSAAAGGSQKKGQVAVDIYEQDNYYIIKAPIAGIRLSDLDIEISDNVVTIRGKRQQHDNIPSEHYYLRECFWGEFTRSVTLPCSIDPRRVRATFNKDCVLKILIPKEDKVKIVRISEG